MSSPSQPDPPPTVVTGVTPHTPDPEPMAAVPTIDSEAVTLASARDQLPQLRPPLVPGDLGAFGAHRVLRLLGQGGMGVVYEALDTALGRPVALKLMAPAIASSETGRERFLREARAAAAIRHENVINVYQVGEDAGTPFLTMELLRGDPLGQLIGNGLPIADVVRVGRDVALGLAAAHKIGVVHRDVKPSNIWIESPTGRVRLLDFGLARIGGEASVAVRFNSAVGNGLTQLGELIGTPVYMSPEQADGEPIDFRTDLFSLGAVLCQAVTGRVPSDGKTSAGWVSAIRAGTFTPVNEAAPGTPLALVHLIHALLALRPEDRPRSAEAVAEELLAIGTQLLIDTRSSVAVPVPVPRTAAPEADFDFTSDDAVPAEPRRIRISKRLLLGSAAALVGVLLLLGIVYFVQKSRRQPPGPTTEVPAPQTTPPTTPANALPKGFVSLFNGRDLSGWKIPTGGRKDEWSVANGVLIGTPKPNLVTGTLLSDRDYSDFELRLDYRWMTPGGQTLLLIRANDDKERYWKGLAISVAEDASYKATHNRDMTDVFRNGVVVGFTSRPAGANKPQGEWNSLRVTARRHTIEVELNGAKLPTADLDAPLPTTKPERECFRTKGPIGVLCYYGTIEYRNIIVRPLSE